MTSIIVNGGTPLVGEIKISGAKNAALPLLAASILTKNNLILENVPNLADIRLFLELLSEHGVSVKNQGSVITLNANNILNTKASYDLVKKMRASILVLGPLLARFGKATVSLPGGCAIGTRPIDLHLSGLQKLGASIELADGYVHATISGRLVGNVITMPIISVTATENLMMASTLAFGTTNIINAAKEPEIIDLANCLNKMGAKITGAGTDHITIQGVEELDGCVHSVIPDRIEAGTYAIAAAITRGCVDLFPINEDHIKKLISYLSLIGVDCICIENRLRINATRSELNCMDMRTEPFPGFPTDLQARWMALMCTCNGSSMITETIFENRFMHVPELQRMGADISVQGSSAIVKGVISLTGANVMATDLRASVSLILAGLVATGETKLSRIYHLDRGYENLEKKLINCGAKIYRESNGVEVLSAL